MQNRNINLFNFIGENTYPRLKLILSENNGPKWKSFTIDNQQSGGIPWSNDPTCQWSPWNVIDEAGNYYGTINLSCDGQTVKFTGYTKSETDYSIEDVRFTWNNKLSSFQLTAGKVLRPQNTGPFPDAPRATPATYKNTETAIQLSAKDSQIIDNKGQEIILKGMVRPSLEWNASGQFLSPQDIGNIASWGSNVIRLDLNQNYWFASDSADAKGSYKQIIDAIIHYATQNEMAVILDLHWVEDGIQSPMANKKSIAFWKEVAAQYKDFGTVIFELYNEPVNIDSQTWLKGSDTYAGYQELYDAVRSQGAKNLVICNGLNWGYDLSFVNFHFEINGDNIIYGSHPYNRKRTEFPQNFTGVLNRKPIIFTEFGVNQPSYFPSGYETIYKDVLDFANENHISYTGFAWWVEDNPGKANVFPCLIQDWQGTPYKGGELVKKDIPSATRFFRSIPQHSPGFFRQIEDEDYLVIDKQALEAEMKNKKP